MPLTFEVHEVLKPLTNALQNWLARHMLLDHQFGSANHAMVLLDNQQHVPEKAITKMSPGLWIKRYSIYI